MKDSQVTIVVVPRERFDLAARSLRSIYEQSDIPFRLVDRESHTIGDNSAVRGEQFGDRAQRVASSSTHYGSKFNSVIGAVSTF